MNRGARLSPVSWVSLALLALAVVVLVGAEWPRLETRFGREARRRRERTRRKASLKLLRGATEDPDEALRAESEKFVASVERDLSQLPTIEENDRRR
jgi:hypothetical protein